MRLLPLAFLSLSPLVSAAQLPLPLSIGPKSGVTILPWETVKQWVNPAWYSAAVYCKNKHVEAWTCGEPCEKLPKPRKIVVGGDGAWNPRWLVASLPGEALLVSLAGTDAASNFSVSIDLDFELVDTENTYFPKSVKRDVMFHKGFYNAFKRIIPGITDAVDAGRTGANQTIIVTGHSLGGALSYLVGTYLQKRYKDATVYIRAFAPPRVGNTHWADYVDETFGMRAQHMVNFQDAVPHLPPRDLGFWRPSWEVWQQPSDENGGSRYWLCEGQENTRCSDQAYSIGREVLLLPYFANQLGVAQHLGPYVNVTLSNIDCPK